VEAVATLETEACKDNAKEGLAEGSQQRESPEGDVVENGRFAAKEVPAVRRRQVHSPVLFGC